MWYIIIVKQVANVLFLDSDVLHAAKTLKSGTFYRPIPI